MFLPCLAGTSTKEIGNGSTPCDRYVGKKLTREGLYEAMRNHRTYVSFDRNLEMAVSAKGQMMGSILPAKTKKINLKIQISDPDANDVLDKVVVYKTEVKSSMSTAILPAINLIRKYP